MVQSYGVSLYGALTLLDLVTQVGHDFCNPARYARGDAGRLNFLRGQFQTGLCMLGAFAGACLAGRRAAAVVL